MKARLLHPDVDFDWRWVFQAVDARRAAPRGWWRYRGDNFNPHQGLPWNVKALTSDLGLDVVFETMADGDAFIFEVVRKVILAGVQGDLDTILYRQPILSDCLNNAALVRQLYAIATDAMAERRDSYFGTLDEHPDWVLRDSIEVVAGLLEPLRKLREIADADSGKFLSRGWATFFTMLKTDLGDEYLLSVERHLQELKFRKHGFLLSAALGPGNKPSRYVLHRPLIQTEKWWDWLRMLFKRKPPPYAFELHPRDEAGSQALSVIRNRGLSSVATALGQSADHVRGFLQCYS